MKKSGACRRAGTSAACKHRIRARPSTRRRRRPRRARSASCVERQRLRRRTARRARARSSGVRFATNAISAPREARFEAASSPIRPAPISSTRRPVELAEHLGGERRGRRRDRSRALADRRLAAHALADGERLAEDAVEQRSRLDRLVALREPGRGSRPRPGRASRARRQRGTDGSAASSSCRRYSDAVERLAGELARAPRAREPRRSPAR